MGQFETAAGRVDLGSVCKTPEFFVESADKQSKFMTSRRKDPRRACLARAVLTYQNEQGAEIQAHGMIEDRSKCGLGIRVSEPIHSGCHIHVQQGSQVYSGVVKRCSTCKAECGFAGTNFIGIEISPKE